MEHWRRLLGLSVLLTTPAGATVVNDLPGYGPPPTAHHSGFIEVDEKTSTNLFYYLVESQSDPGGDPLLWWMNGGPGASSLVGLLAENGPLLLNDQNKLVSNPYSWNRRANVLYVEFGPGIGYSYCANSSLIGPGQPCSQERSDCSPCDASDSSVARYNAILLERLLTGVFPSMAGRPLYIAGESYAGVYIPTAAVAIAKHFPDTSVANLHGLWITDPCMDNKAQFGWLDLGPDFCYQKGLISKDTHDALTDPTSPCVAARTAVGDRVRNTKSKECKRAWRLYDLATAGIGNAVHAAQVPGLPLYIDPLSAYGVAVPGGDIPGYLTRPDVRLALHASQSPNKIYHVELGNNGYSNYLSEYSACNLKAKEGVGSMVDVHHYLATAGPAVRALANLKRIMILSGDIDPVVDMHGTEAAVNAIGFQVSEGGDRRPWFYNSSATSIDVLGSKPIAWGPSLHAHNAGMQVGGFVTNYDTGAAKRSFDFVTVRNSGHMVPAYAPQRALHIVQAALLEGQALVPRLPSDWDTSEDIKFYGKGTTKGEFASWVVNAMSDPAAAPSTDQDDKSKVVV